MSGHTPGPWICAAGHGNQSLCLESSDGMVLGNVRAFAPSGETRHDIEVQMRWEEGFANARLIAAAPELLEALQGMLETFGLRQGATQLVRHPVHGEMYEPVNQALIDVCDQARAAVSKVTGSAP